MTPKLVVAIILSIVVPCIAFAQKQSPIDTAPKPSIAQVRKLVQMISTNKAKLKIYCDLNQLDEQLEEAEHQKDREILEALNAKADNLEQQISPEYTKVMDSLEIIDPNSSLGCKDRERTTSTSLPVRPSGPARMP
jgi:hypothetical protein